MAERTFEDLRMDAGDQALRRADLSPEPLTLFRGWLDQAIGAGVREANAMSLATCDSEGQPHCRVVLMKQLDANGFGFFTNKCSGKGEQLRANARAAATFWWVAPRPRQVRIEGVVRELPEADALAYFASRPKRAQLCGAASPQSQVVKNRTELEGIVDALADQVGDGPVPKPAHWGGYSLLPKRVEFWQGREGRLHDRFQFCLEGGVWRIDRLAP